MHSRYIPWVVMAALCVWVIDGRPARGDEPGKGVWDGTATPPTQARQAIERGLAFLQRDAAKWREERKCASCHQGVMTVWALSEAKNQGYKVNGTSLAEFTTWAKERLVGIDKPRDTRPGWNTVSTPALYMAVMARAIPAQDAVNADDIKRIDGHLLRHQEDNGSWAWSLTPAQNRPPPVFESDEVATLMGCLALGSRVPADQGEMSPVQDSVKKATAWLAKTSPGDDTQAIALRLLMQAWIEKPPKTLKTEIDRLRSRQRQDGGWGQAKDLPSDAYATGQALYVLGLTGVKNDRAIRRGVGFLIATQREDGSWPMTSRAQPGATPFKNPAPITYFGSAWATLGLLRSVSK